MARATLMRPHQSNAEWIDRKPSFKFKFILAKVRYKSLLLEGTRSTHRGKAC